MSAITKIDFIGLGALGIQYAHYMESRLGAGSVRFIADTVRTARYRADGVFCNDEKCSFEFLTPDDYSGKSKLLIFSVKSTGLKAAIETVRPIVDDQTTIISLLNGISSEEILRDAFPQTHVLYCIGQKMDALKTGNKVYWKNIGELCIGLPSEQQQDQPYLTHVTALFDRIEVPYVLEQDILHRLWCKWMLNVGVNQAVMVYEGDFAMVQREGESRRIMISAMKEVQALSQKCGVNISDEEFSQYLNIIDNLYPKGMPSMRQDGVSKRKSEVEIFAGTVIRKGRELGVPTPTNEFLYKRVQEMEAAYGNK